ncbi:VanW family protein [Microlunatus sp. Y2014]|uniref:VanW family protein n=1 Tax=Microlunatus sp. Y2014 TaxID=3418488 RepID=UPI003DA6ED19
MSTDEEKPTKPSRMRPWKLLTLILGGLLLVLLGTYVVGYVMAGENTPRNATVDGIPIGGMSRDEAIATLERELGPKGEAELTVVVDGEEHKVKPAEAGLTIDFPATVDQSGLGRSFDPRHLWRVLAGGTELSPVVAVDEEALTNRVAELAKATDRKAINAAVAFEDDKPKVTASQEARTLNQEQTATLLKQSFLVRDQVVVPVELVEPEITDAEAAAAKEFATALTSGPVVLKLAGSESTYEVPVSTLTQAYTFAVENGTVVPKFDAKKLYELNAKALDKLPNTKPKDARVEIRGGKPTVVPAVDGTRIDEAALAKAVEPVAGKTGKERTVTVTPNAAKAEHTTAEAQQAGVKEVVGEFTTTFPYAEYRNVNLAVAAGFMNNTYLQPGEQFSMNGELGTRTPAKGYIDGYFIEGGILKKGLAGGISQSATTVYNAAFFAGLQIDEHQPHTLYFPRYPAGRESTVYYPSIDVKFTNDTKYGVVVQAFVNKASPGQQGSITVRIWSTKNRTVESAEPTKSDFTTGKTRYIDDPKCEYQAPIKGFTAKYYRIIKDLNGQVIKREDYVWKYTPGDEIRCGKPPGDDG